MKLSNLINIIKIDREKIITKGFHYGQDTSYGEASSYTDTKLFTILGHVIDISLLGLICTLYTPLIITSVLLLLGRSFLLCRNGRYYKRVLYNIVPFKFTEKLSNNRNKTYGILDEYITFLSNKKLVYFVSKLSPKGKQSLTDTFKSVLNFYTKIFFDGSYNNNYKNNIVYYKKYKEFIDILRTMYGIDINEYSYTYINRKNITIKIKYDILTNILKDIEKISFIKIYNAILKDSVFVFENSDNIISLEAIIEHDTDEEITELEIKCKSKGIKYVLLDDFSVKSDITIK